MQYTDLGLGVAWRGEEYVGLGALLLNCGGLLVTAGDGGNGEKLGGPDGDLLRDPGRDG